MRVAYLVNQYPKTSHSFIRREIVGLEARGIEVSRFTVREVDEPLVDAEDQAEHDRTRVLLSGGALGLLAGLVRTAATRPIRLWRALGEARRLARESDRGFLYHLAYLAEACVLLGYLRAADVSHLHAHFGTNAASVALLCNALGGPPFSFTVHSPLSSEVPQICAMRHKLQRARFVVAVSDHGRSQLMRWSSREQWEKIHVVRCGTDDVFRVLEHAEDRSDRSRRLVCVGRMSPEKGHGVLLRAAASLAERGADFDLELIGDGPLRPELERLAAELGLAERVHFQGWRSGVEVREAILASRALVLPSFIEGLPVVLMEALALERPVIATWVGAIPELVVHESTGWLVTPGSHEALAEACDAALEVPDETWSEMGARGAQAVRERHDSSVEAARLATLFETEAEAA